MIDAVIIGGGLGGIFTAWQLDELGLKVLLIEKKRYPFHRVCGEYISNEVLPFLERRNLFPMHLSPAVISKFLLTSINGSSLQMELDLGGFGISRHAWDHWLIERLQEKGIEVWEGKTVTNIDRHSHGMQVTTNDGRSIDTKIAVGAFGKRSVLDKALDRSFMARKSPFIGVKYHVKYDFPDDTVALHNFPGGYCGINKVEGDRYNLCYLSRRENLKKFGKIDDMESRVLSQNPHLRDIFRNAEFLMDPPEVINEITFEAKEPVYRSIFMVGDSAGMITPLCGNGMAMAIHASKLLSESIADIGLDTASDRLQLEKVYTNRWKQKFAFRLSSGRTIQKLFGARGSSALAVAMGKTVKPVANLLMAQTHGDPFS